METIHVIVATSNGIFESDYPKTEKIQKVIDDIIADRGLEQGDNFELFFDGEPLKPTTRTLVSFGLDKEAKLQLVATGSGV